MSSSHKYCLKLIVLVLVTLCLPLQGQADASKEPTRAERVVMQLKMGSGSAGFHMLESERYARDMQKGLRKALYKVREADRLYAKSVGKPDTRYFEAVTVKLATCKEKSEALEKEISETFQELKTSINQTLIMGAMKE